MLADYYRQVPSVVKVTELEHKIKTAESKPDISNLATKSSLTVLENKIPDVNDFVKKTDYSTEITSIKNDYVTNAALASQLNDLKNQRISDEVKKVNDKVVKNTSDILKYKALDHNKSVIDDLEREASFSRGFYYYIQQSYFLYEQNLNRLVEMDGLFIHGYQEEFIITKTILTYFL